MGKFDGILIATDLDGTLVSDGKVSKENADAIRYFQKEGGLFTVATGRYVSHIKENFANDIDPNTCIMTLNGNVLYDMKEDKKLRVSKMDKENAQMVLSYSTDKFKDSILFINICDEDESYKYDGKVERDTCKCVYVMKDCASAIALRDDLRKNFSHLYNAERSWPTGVEIYSKYSGKGEAIKYIREKIHPEIKIAICVGDYENDVSMLKEADIGYAVANATEEVKNAADRITAADNDHHAIAWIIDKLDKEGI